MENRYNQSTTHPPKLSDHPPHREDRRVTNPKPHRFNAESAKQANALSVASRKKLRENKESAREHALSLAKSVLTTETPTEPRQEGLEASSVKNLTIAPIETGSPLARPYDAMLNAALAAVLSRLAFEDDLITKTNLPDTLKGLAALKTAWSPARVESAKYQMTATADLASVETIRKRLTARVVASS